MSISLEIEGGIKKAMVEKDELSLSTLRLLKSAIKNAEIEKGSELDDAEALVVLEKQAKQRRDSIDQYEKGDRPELAEKEKKELEMIEKFLPAKMGEDEVREVVKKVVSENEGADFGRVMGAAMGQLKGKADGSVVQKIVKEELGA